MILPKLIVEIEKWKFNSQYNVYVSNLGNVKNSFGKKIKPSISSNGYMLIKIDENRAVRQHSLVMKTWKPLEDYTNMTIDHLNHNKRDNSLKNLEWVSEEENLKRAEEDQVAVIKPDYLFIATEETKKVKRDLKEARQNLIEANTEINKIKKEKTDIKQSLNDLKNQEKVTTQRMSSLNNNLKKKEIDIKNMPYMICGIRYNFDDVSKIVNHYVTKRHFITKETGNTILENLKKGISQNIYNFLEIEYSPLK